MTATPAFDHPSVIGKFGWEPIGLDDTIAVPVILRNDTRYVPIRIVEQDIIRKYENLPRHFFTCISLESFYMTTNEANLVNTINKVHCDNLYGQDLFSTNSMLMNVSDVKPLSRFLNISYKIFTSDLSEFVDKMGIIEIYRDNVSETIKVPYVCKYLDGYRQILKFVPDNILSNKEYNFGETAVSAKASHWDVMHCKMLSVYGGIELKNPTFNLISIDGLKYVSDGSLVKYRNYLHDKLK